MVTAEILLSYCLVFQIPECHSRCVHSESTPSISFYGFVHSVDTPFIWCCGCVSLAVGESPRKERTRHKEGTCSTRDLLQRSCWPSRMWPRLQLPPSRRLWYVTVTLSLCHCLCHDIIDNVSLCCQDCCFPSCEDCGKSLLLCQYVIVRVITMPLRQCVPASALSHDLPLPRHITFIRIGCLILHKKCVCSPGMSSGSPAYSWLSFTLPSVLMAYFTLPYCLLCIRQFILPDVFAQILHTTLGDIHLKLYPEECPRTVENFTVHCRNGYYDGIIFHRVIKVLQCTRPWFDGALEGVVLHHFCRALFEGHVSMAYNTALSCIVQVPQKATCPLQEA